MEDEVTDQLALVTGGGSGIGRATTLALARRGYRVAVTARSAPDLEATLALVRELPGAHAVSVVGDVSVPDDVDRVVGEVEDRLGPVDLLVNSAGISVSRPGVGAGDS